MQEDFRKNFVLLSRVAREKKYAQEYLGLLARRGDIGSIRVGKRWYTTLGWFDEFLKDTEIRRAETRDAEVKIELAGNLVIKKEEKKIDERKLEIEKEETIPLRIATRQPFPREKEFRTIDLRGVGAKRFLANGKVPLKKVFNREKVEKLEALQYLEKMNSRIQERGVRSGNSSPNFADFVPRIPLFQKLAFSAAVMLLLILLFQISWVYKDELKRIARLDSRLDSAKRAARLAGIEAGVVAGAENNKVGLEAIRNSSIDYLGSRGDRVRENISISRVAVRAAMERNGNQ